MSLISHNLPIFSFPGADLLVPEQLRDRIWGWYALSGFLMVYLRKSMTISHGAVDFPAVHGFFIIFPMDFIISMGWQKSSSPETKPIFLWRSWEFAVPFFPLKKPINWSSNHQLIIHVSSFSPWISSSNLRKKPAQAAFFRDKNPSGIAVHGWCGAARRALGVG